MNFSYVIATVISVEAPLAFSQYAMWCLQQLSSCHSYSGHALLFLRILALASKGATFSVKIQILKQCLCFQELFLYLLQLILLVYLLHEKME